MLHLRKEKFQIQAHARKIKFCTNYGVTCVHENAKLRVRKKNHARGAAWWKQSLPLHAAYQESPGHHQ